MITSAYFLVWEEREHLLQGKRGETAGWGIVPAPWGSSLPSPDPLGGMSLLIIHFGCSCVLLCVSRARLCALTPFSSAHIEASKRHPEQNLQLRSLIITGLQQLMLLGTSFSLNPPQTCSKSTSWRAWAQPPDLPGKGGEFSTTPLAKV